MSEYNTVEDKTCPTCGDEFPSLRGMKVHHNLVHGESIAGTVVSCDWCGEEKTMNPAHARAHDLHFCDDGCKGEWQSENLTGEDATNWRGGGVNVECENCGSELTRMVATVENNDHQFCNRECYGKWREGNFVGDENWNYDPDKGEDVSCFWCGTEFRKAKNFATERSFCTNECYNNWRSEWYSGDGNPNWKGGHEHGYGYSWKEQRDKALKRDDNECQVCGAGHEEASPRLHVHHIIPMRKFGTKRAAHQLGNLITLCPHHHGAVEHGEVECPLPRSPMTPQTVEDG